MEPGICDSSILLLYHQLHVGSSSFGNSAAAGSKYKAGWPITVYALSYSVLEWKPHSHALQTCHSVRGSVFLLCLLVPAHLALVLFAWAALSWPCQGLIMKLRPKHLPGTAGKQVRSWNH